jgi:hypothetical protein
MLSLNIVCLTVALAYVVLRSKKFEDQDEDRRITGPTAGAHGKGEFHDQGDNVKK